MAAGRRRGVPPGEVERLRNQARDVYERRKFLGLELQDPSEISPADLLIQEVSRTAAIVRWIESHMSEWDDGLAELQEKHEGTFAPVFARTEEALWYDVYQKERAHLARTAKMAIDAGIAERQVRLAEQQVDMMVAIIDRAFDRLQLEPVQKARIPYVLGEVIREVQESGS